MAAASASSDSRFLCVDTVLSCGVGVLSTNALNCGVLGPGTAKASELGTDAPNCGVYVVFAQIQTYTSFHEMGHACAYVRPRVHVSIHRAVSIAPLAESYLVFRS